MTLASGYLGGVRWSLRQHLVLSALSFATDHWRLVDHNKSMVISGVFAGLCDSISFRLPLSFATDHWRLVDHNKAGL
jgi:hypothetical protein